MQKEILEEHPDSDVRVYVIWLSMLPQDSRAHWDAGLMPDRRATHLWDRDRSVSRWFGEHMERIDGFVWDTYLLYGPDARWDAIPAPLLGAGRTMIERREAWPSRSGPSSPVNAS
ncbi:MAG: hypothetical protein AB7R89_01620 [Dehalococcoidia bacterium]